VKTAIRKHLGDFIWLTALFVMAIGIAAYIVSQQESRSRIPFIEEKGFNLKAEFSDAQAVVPGQGQSVRVAGVEVGKIRKVELKNGVGLVTMEFDPKFVTNDDGKGRVSIRADATALLRPRTGLKDMFVELDPGRAGQDLEENAVIPEQNTEPDVDPDEILAVLDTDTRSYLQLLVNGVGKGLRGRGGDLRNVFRRFEPLNRDLARVSQAIASRRRNLMRLIHNYGELTNELARDEDNLTRLVETSAVTFEAFASQDDNISLAVSRLPGALSQTEATLRNVDTFARVLAPSLESLRPAFRQLDETNREVLPFVREAEPIVRRQIRPFVRTARPFVRQLRPAASGLARATPDLNDSLFELNRFFNMAAFNPNGAEPLTGNQAQDRARDEGYLFWVGWVAQNTVSLFSTSDAQGPFRRAVFGLTCATIREQVQTNPAADTLVGFIGPLSDPTLCAPGQANRNKEAEPGGDEAPRQDGTEQPRPAQPTGGEQPSVGEQVPPLAPSQGEER
jgi:phospholipid/cholesterol/gamma-HCH transport system substrate-binding protein